MLGGRAGRGRDVSRAPNPAKGSEDLSAELYLAYPRHDLFLALKVHDDVLIDPAAVIALADFLENRPDVAAVCPTLNAPQIRPLPTPSNADPAFVPTAPEAEVAAPSGHRLYAEAFRKYGIALPAPAPAAEQIRSSAIRESLLAFLHDWLFWWAPEVDRDKLRAVLDRADDDDWRRQIRETCPNFRRDRIHDRTMEGVVQIQTTECDVFFFERRCDGLECSRFTG